MAIRANYPDILPSLNLDFANTKKLDPRITFTRTTTATYYDGVTVAKAEENLVLQSQAFDSSSWTKYMSTATGDSTTAPDGTTTADTITEDTNSNAHGPYQGVAVKSGLAYTWSAYVKANGRTIVQLDCQATASIYKVEFDLSAVTTTNRTGTGTATITDAGNGWYRITATATSTGSGTGYWQLLLCSAANTHGYLGDGTSGIYIWGAQLEQRSAVSSYTATTTQAITNYIPVLQTAASGQARFDHNPTTGESLGLLIEEQRTNSLTYSDDFANAAWTKGNSTISSNVIVAPDGTLTGDKLYENTSTSSHDVSQSIGTKSGAYTWSIYAKAAERDTICLNAFTSGSTRVFFYLSTGTYSIINGSPTVTMTPVGNGWYKCTSTVTAGSSTYSFIAEIVKTGSYSYTGDGYSGIYIWGAQLEAGAFATSYIPTTSASVTRNADAASMTGTNFSSWYRADEGTVYCEASINSPVTSSGEQEYFAISNGTTANRITAYRYLASVYGDMWANNVSQFATNLGSAPTTTPIKIALAYKINDSVFSRDGSASSTDTSCILPVVDRLIIGNRADSSTNTCLGGGIKKLAYYPLRLTNAQLQALTTV